MKPYFQPLWVCLTIVLVLPAAAGESCRDYFERPSGDPVRRDVLHKTAGWGERIMWYLFGEGKIRFLSETTQINGIKSYEIDAKAASAENELGFAAKMLLSKYGGSIFLQNHFILLQKDVRGFTDVLKRKHGEFTPAMVFRRMIAKHPSLWAGTIWHEFVHAGDYADAFEGKDLGRLRTLKFKLPGNGKLRFGVQGYDREFILGEIHAHVVQAGVNLRDASRAIENGDLRRARALLKLVGQEKQRVERFMIEADDQFSFIRDKLLNSPSSVKLTRKGAGNGTVLICDYQFPFFGIGPEGLGRKLSRWLRAVVSPGSADPVRIVALIDPSVDESRHAEYLAEFFARAQSDYHRFDETFAHFMDRAADLEKQIAAR